MCFYVKPKDKCAKIAKKDIHCLKVLTLENGKLYSPSSFLKTTLWKKNVTHVVRSIKRFGVKNINEGLHSLKSFHGTKSWIGCHAERHVYMAIIPAGSIYWENDTQYVSERLKIVDDKPITYYRWRQLKKSENDKGKKKSRTK